MCGRPCGSVVEHSLGKGEVAGPIPAMGTMPKSIAKACVELSTQAFLFPARCFAQNEQPTAVFARIAARTSDLFPATAGQCLTDPDGRDLLPVCRLVQNQFTVFHIASQPRRLAFLRRFVCARHSLQLSAQAVSVFGMPLKPDAALAPGGRLRIASQVFRWWCIEKIRLPLAVQVFGFQFSWCGAPDGCS